MFESTWKEVKSLSNKELEKAINQLEAIRKNHPGDLVALLMELDLKENLRFAGVCHLPREKAFDGTQYHYRFLNAKKLSKALNTLAFLPEYINS